MVPFWKATIGYILAQEGLGVVKKSFALEHIRAEDMILRTVDLVVEL